MNAYRFLEYSRKTGLFLGDITIHAETLSAAREYIKENFSGNPEIKWVYSAGPRSL